MTKLNTDPEYQALRWELDLVEDREREAVCQLLEASGYELDAKTGEWRRKRRADPAPISGEITQE